MVLPLGETGLDWVPNQDAVIAALQEGLKAPGVYILPGYDMSREPSEAERAAWEGKYRRGPIGFLVYQPAGQEPMSSGQLLTELASNVAAALVVAVILSAAAVGFGHSVLLAALLGLFSWLSLSVSYWNWMGFPADYTIAQGIIEVVGWLLAGLAMARLVRST